MVPSAHLHDSRASGRGQCRGSQAPPTLSVRLGEGKAQHARGSPCTRGSACAHTAFLWEGLLHTGVTWLPQGLGGLWHCCHWYLKQLRENLDRSCYSHTSCGHCGGTEMEQLLLPCPSQAPVLHHSLLFSNCWETGTAGPANYHHFKEQSYVWKAILFPIQKQKEMRIS